MMEILAMCREHVEQVAAIEAICFRDPWSLKSITDELQNPLSHWLVCVEAGKVVGYVGSQTVMGETDMMNIAVLPDFRNRGIASSLLKQLVQDLKERESSSLSLEVRASNEPAIALYEKYDFRQIGRRPNYYRNPKEDALILKKEWSL